MEAYRLRLQRGADLVRRDRAEHRQEESEEASATGITHLFEDVDLKKVGSHTCKRSTVMLTKDVCNFSAVIGAICGTSAGTLDKHYDDKTAKRQ